MQHFMQNKRNTTNHTSSMSSISIFIMHFAVSSSPRAQNNSASSTRQFSEGRWCSWDKAASATFAHNHAASYQLCSHTQSSSQCCDLETKIWKLECTRVQLAKVSILVSRPYGQCLGFGLKTFCTKVSVLVSIFLKRS